MNDPEPLTDGTYRARWVLPVHRSPIAGGYVQIRNGVVTACSDLPPGPLTADWEDCAILPGLVNAHCHLEFSHFAEPLGAPGMSLPTWLGEVIRSRQHASGFVPSRNTVIRRGIEECASRGIALLGEIATAPANLEDYSSLLLETLVFPEVIGLSAHRASETFAWATEFQSQFVNQKVSSQRLLGVGISPHAPYSTSLEILATAVAHSHRSRCPLAIHLAESREERELVESGTGEFRDFLEGLGLSLFADFPHPKGMTGYLEMLRDASRCLIVHGNYLLPDEMDLIAEHERISVVYCPRTHAYFCHSPYPLEMLRQRGIRVVLGTDSRASNPDLSIWREACLVRRLFSSIPSHEILDMITRDAAIALGDNPDAPRFGTLRVGSSPRPVRVACTGKTVTAMWEELFAS
jgi:cytosine/adenosine deaminase-related metal-dependent hydrolase